MSRGISSTLRSRFQSDGIRLATLIYMERGGSVYRLTDYGKNLTYNSSTYFSSSHLLDVSQASETQELRVNDMTLTLSGVDQTFISKFLSNPNFTSDKVIIYRAALSSNTDTTVSADEAFVAFEGRISEYAISEDGTDSTVEVTITSHWADFEKYNGRKTNANSQKLHFPNDKGFEFASKTVKDLRWGRKS